MINTKSHFHRANFFELTVGFPSILEALKISHCDKIGDYYKPGSGVKTIAKQLGMRCDVSGLYVFYRRNRPFYTGISGGILNRIQQHVKGNDHNSSSLCYKLGAAQHMQMNGIAHTGGRAGLDFNLYGRPAREELMKSSFRFIEMDNDVQLYLFEAFVSMELGTMYYNQFRTH